MAERKTILAVALLATAGIAAYANAFTDVFVGYNALRSIRDNADIGRLWPLWRAMSLHLTGEAALADGGTFVRRPVLSLSFALNQALLGNQPWGYQLVNILIHIAAGVVLFALVRRTLELPKLRGRLGFDATGVAAAVALLWIVHPLQTQSVTYFVQRAESLMGMFFLLTIYAGARACAGDGGRWQPLAWIACALGMGTKEVMVTAPIVLYLYDAILVSDSFATPLRRRASFYAALAATWLIPGALVLATMPDVMIDFRPGRTWPYLLAQPGVLLHYLRLSFWPHPLYLYVNTQLFSIEPAVTPIWQTMVATVVVGVMLAISVGAIVKRRWYGFLAGAFFLILAPTCTVIATNDALQDHRMYLPLAAVIAFTVIAASKLLGSLGDSPRRVTAVALVAVAAAALISATRARNWAYHDELGAYHPADLSMAQGILARYAAFRGDVEDAERRYREILALPESAFGVGPPHGRFHRARVHNDLGGILLQRGAIADAAAQFAQAVGLQASFAPAQNNAGALALLQGDIGAARGYFDRALSLTPGSPEAHNNLGLLFAGRGKWPEAHLQLEEAVRRAPSFEVARKNLRALGEGRLRGDAPELEARVRFMLDDPWVVLRLRAAIDDGMTR